MNGTNSSNQFIDKNIDKDIKNNIKTIKDILAESDDLIYREFNIKTNKPIRAFICCIDELIDKSIFTDHVLKALMVDVNFSNIKNVNEEEDIVSILKNEALSVLEVGEESSFKPVIDSILAGEVALFIDKSNKAIIIDTRKFNNRNVDQPDTEVTVRGSREGFNENLKVNISLIRRIIKNPNLVFKSLNIGSQTNTKVCICYVKGIADNKIVEEVEERLNKIDIDAVLESGYIEQLIDDNPYSVVSTVGNSERPDKIAGKLLEGRVAILCDGTPFVLSVPYLFIESFQVNEDYYSRPYIASVMRMIRGLAFITTVTLPALYIALETYHQEMIPSVLILTAAAAREGTPFPTFVEVTVMEVLLALLRESGVRMPRPIGQTVSFIGALVIGQSAVQAGIISAPMVIIGSLTAISSFIIPSLFDSTILLRYLLIVLSAVFGMHGIVLGISFIVIHFCSLRSFGVPYLEPIAPTISRELKDAFLRVPLWFMNYRPKLITRKYSRRQGVRQKPKKPNNKDGSEKN